MGTTRGLRGMLFLITFIMSVLIMHGLLQAAPLTLNVSIGIRETQAGGGAAVPIGANGGSSGGIEFINLDGQSFVANGTWQQFTFTPNLNPLTAFAGTTANGVLDGTYGVFEHIRIRSTDDPGPWVIYVDDVVNQTFAGSTPITGFEGFAVGTEVMFQEPTFSGSTSLNIIPGATAGVSDEQANSGDQSYKIEFEFVDGDPTRWVRLTTFNTPNIPNPAVILRETSFNPTISFWLMAPPTSTAVPEPSTMLLIGSGLIGLAGYGRKKFFRK